jgi:hypothetical protein
LAVNMKTVAIWDVKPRNFVARYKHLDESSLIPRKVGYCVPEDKR